MPGQSRIAGRKSTDAGRSKVRASHIAAVVAAAVAGCSDTSKTPNLSEIELAFEQYELDNGLDVILHVDRSDPTAAVLMTFHVGSARERPNRTGFARLFEHSSFSTPRTWDPAGSTGS
jgi:zinc protease